MVCRIVAQGCAGVRMTMVASMGAPDLYITYSFMAAHPPVAGVGYDGRKLTPAVAPTHDDDKREGRRT